MIDRSLLNEEAVEHLTRGGYTCVLWNVIPRDRAFPNGWVEGALEMCEAHPEALVVQHDLPTGAMSGLDRFIGAARDRGATFAQDFPASCIPIERGRLQAPIDLYMTRANG